MRRCKVSVGHVRWVCNGHPGASAHQWTGAPSAASGQVTAVTRRRRCGSPGPGHRPESSSEHRERHVALRLAHALVEVLERGKVDERHVEAGRAEPVGRRQERRMVLEVGAVAAWQVETSPSCGTRSPPSYLMGEPTARTAAHAAHRRSLAPTTPSSSPAAANTRRGTCVCRCSSGSSGDALP